MFLVYNEETHKYDRLGLNAEMFKLIDEKEDEVYEMEEYFDENDNPLDDEFAKHYDLSKFVGEEYVEEK